jgi:hypothetical protein
LNEEDGTVLAIGFNYAEARRRLGNPVSTPELAELVTTYERNALKAGMESAVLRLNRMQAMHILYALVGEVDRARELLLQAQELTAMVSPRERVFSVVDYAYVTADQFVLQNRQMLDALSEGRLWDGTSLTAS